MLNALFTEPSMQFSGKVGHIASEDVTILLLRTKCLPVLYYGLGACSVKKAQIKLLVYALDSCFRKIFSTRDQVVVNHCMVFFDFSSVSEAVKCKQQRYQMSPNTVLCHLMIRLPLICNAIDLTLSELSIVV